MCHWHASSYKWYGPPERGTTRYPPLATGYDDASCTWVKQRTENEFRELLEEERKFEVSYFLLYIAFPVALWVWPTAEVFCFRSLECIDIQWDRPSGNTP